MQPTARMEETLCCSGSGMEPAHGPRHVNMSRAWPACLMMVRGSVVCAFWWLAQRIACCLDVGRRWLILEREREPPF